MKIPRPVVDMSGGDHLCTFEVLCVLLPHMELCATISTSATLRSCNVESYQRAYTERADTRAPTICPLGSLPLSSLCLGNHQCRATKARPSLTKHLTV